MKIMTKVILKCLTLNYSKTMSTERSETKQNIKLRLTINSSSIQTYNTNRDRYL